MYVMRNIWILGKQIHNSKFYNLPIHKPNSKYFCISKQVNEKILTLITGTQKKEVQNKKGLYSKRTRYGIQIKYRINNF